MRAPNPAGLLLVAACGAPSPSFPAPSPAPTARIAPGELAHSHSTSSQHVALPFELDRTGASGTALVLGFLERASASGARYVSDVSIVLQVVHAGVPVECVSRIAIDDGHRAPPAPPPPADEPAGEGEYSTTVRPWHPELVTAWVLDRDYVCKKVGHQVVVPTPQYADPYDTEVPRYIEPGKMPTRRESQIVWTDDCHYEPARRQVTRYGHFVAARFAPAELPRIAAYSDYKLVEEPPECHQIAPGKMQQRIEGEIYFAGPLTDAKIPVPEPLPPAPVGR